jgi:hypothetical protein
MTAFVRHSVILPDFHKSIIRLGYPPKNEEMNIFVSITTLIFPPCGIL